MKFYNLYLSLVIATVAFGLWPKQAQATSAGPVTGVYRLTTRAQSGMAIEVANLGNANNSTVQMNIANHQCNQQWFVEAQGDGSYKIYAYSGQNSLQMMDDDNGGVTNGTLVHTWEDNGTINQLWYIQNVGGGYYRIIPKNAGVSGTATMEVVGGNTATAGSTTDINTYSGGDNQVFKMDWSGPSQTLPNPKKGISAHDVQLAAMHSAWTYNWSYGTPTDIPTGTEYVPILWNWGSDTDIANKILNADPGMTHVLGFNEPDFSSQANMSVALALQGFQYLSGMSSSGIGVGSPAAADDGDTWMQSFMSQAVTTPYNYHIDFVCLHHYPTGNTAASAAGDLLGYIDFIHTLYGKPIWVTEYAPTNMPSVAEAMAFVKLTSAGFANRPYVQRYAMFTSMSPAASGWGASALVNDDGTITAVGQLYARM